MAVSWWATGTLCISMHCRRCPCRVVSVCVCRLTVMDATPPPVQDQVSRLSAGLWRFSSWQQLPPAASISVCRADRSTVRASLRPQAVVPRLVHQLQQAGWPLCAAASCSKAAGGQQQLSLSSHSGATAAASALVDSTDWRVPQSAPACPGDSSSSSSCTVWAEPVPRPQPADSDSAVVLPACRQQYSGRGTPEWYSCMAQCLQVRATRAAQSGSSILCCVMEGVLQLLDHAILIHSRLECNQLQSHVHTCGSWFPFVLSA